MKRDDETENEYQRRTYNGWEGSGDHSSAYATWRVNLEILDGQDWSDQFPEKPEPQELADAMKELVEEIVFMEDYRQEKLVSQYAAAFLDDVNYYEIAENIIADWED